MKAGEEERKINELGERERETEKEGERKQNKDRVRRWSGVGKMESP